MSRARLEELRPENFSAILILADESGSGAIVDADSRSLAVQLLLRDIQARRSCCILDVLDQRTWQHDLDGEATLA